MNYRNVSYIHQTDDGWSPIELVDEAKEKPWTKKTRHEWDLAVDSAGNVFAVYLVPTVERRLRERSSGQPGGGGEHVSLPDESYGYRLAPDADGKVHLLYRAQGKVWHNGVSVSD